LGVPSDHFFHLLWVIMAQLEQYVGAVGHLQGTGCGAAAVLSSPTRRRVASSSKN
jgi:hypothetical protein